MFNKILVANRGEIAVRIIRACRELGIRTVAVYSQADKDALHKELADEAYCIGPSASADSYLNINNIISVAVATGANAIHPGFGFMAENSMFASICSECNIKFIGPKADVIDLMGNKDNARKVMIKNDIPVIPGTDVLASLDDAIKKADKIGYPVMLKASSGGGGKGIRVINSVEDLKTVYDTTKQEAKMAFGDDSLYLEKKITNAKHIEVQILGDSYGNVVHLFERDCSLQRKNQKVLEECPSLLEDDIREQICDVAVRCGKAVNYENAGTIEFLYENGSFYFMEMNTRIQVEHPVTEMVTGIDIVKEQIRIAAGNPLSFTQNEINKNGYAIECRINAEAPERGFAPSPGKLTYLNFPSGCLDLRVDTGVYQGYTIPPFYDSMIAKVIVKGSNREDAIMKMKRALYEFVAVGIDTNIDFQLMILNNKYYQKGDFNTSFIEDEILKRL